MMITTPIALLFVLLCCLTDAFRWPGPASRLLLGRSLRSQPTQLMAQKPAQKAVDPLVAKLLKIKIKPKRKKPKVKASEKLPPFCYTDKSNVTYAFPFIKEPKWWILRVEEGDEMGVAAHLMHCGADQGHVLHNITLDCFVPATASFSFPNNKQGSNLTVDWQVEEGDIYIKLARMSPRVAAWVAAEDGVKEFIRYGHHYVPLNDAEERTVMKKLSAYHASVLAGMIQMGGYVDVPGDYGRVLGAKNGLVQVVLSKTGSVSSYHPSMLKVREAVPMEITVSTAALR